MAVKIASPEDAGQKLGRVAPTRAQDYRDGVASSNVDWAGATAAAKETFATGVQEAINRDAFRKGVQAAGTDKWKKGSVEKGAVRWAPGVQAGLASYVQNVKPYFDAIESTTLPPRRPRGDAANQQRSAIINDRLAAIRRAK
jgi:hypothetical protein